MPFTAADLVRLRPWAYHFTAPANAARLRRGGVIRCAAELLEAAGLSASERRPADVIIGAGADAVVVSHQRPLKKGAIRWDAAGWDFARYVEHLNRRVFFWPGRDAGPVARGRAHLSGLRAAGYSPVVLRVPMAELIGLNAARGPWVTRCNSGATRGRVLRGDGTFRRPEACEFAAVGAAEVTFLSHAVLPRSGE